MSSSKRGWQSSELGGEGGALPGRVVWRRRISFSELLGGEAANYRLDEARAVPTRTWLRITLPACQASRFLLSLSLDDRGPLTANSDGSPSVGRPREWQRLDREPTREERFVVLEGALPAPQHSPRQPKVKTHPGNAVTAARPAKHAVTLRIVSEREHRLANSE